MIVYEKILVTCIEEKKTKNQFKVIWTCAQKAIEGTGEESRQQGFQLSEN